MKHGFGIKEVDQFPHRTHGSWRTTDNNASSSGRQREMNTVLQVRSDYPDDLSRINIPHRNDLNAALHAAREVSQAPHPHSLITRSQSIAVRRKGFVQKPRHLTHGHLPCCMKGHFPSNAGIDDNGHSHHITYDILHHLANVVIRKVKAHPPAIR
ncbi:MAG: hypothetical protein E5V19_00830, partial [Mesorhizobium sp.]